MKIDQWIGKNSVRLNTGRSDGSVLVVTISLVAILMLLLGVMMMSTSNKYLTAYQWASWQEALQGAESGADIAMAEMRKDAGGTSTPWVGWNLGKYATSNGKTYRDNTSYQTISSSGTFADNSGGGGGNTKTFNLLGWTNNSYDFITYSTDLTPHAGEGNQRLHVTVTIDRPASLVDSAGQQWLRVRATGTTDVSGPARVSEEKLDNRLRKLGLFWDKVLAATDNSTPQKRQTTRQIELVAKPVKMFSGALTTMVQLKNDDNINSLYADSFNSEDKTHWPINASTGEIDMTVSHDPMNALGKNGDIGSNAFPIKHDHTEVLDLKSDQIWGDVGNNYSQIKNLDSTYYSNTYNAATNPYGLDNGNFGNTNPNPSLIQTTGSNGADVSGAIATNFYRDLPGVTDPTWNTDNTATFVSTKDGTGAYIVNKGTADMAGNKISIDPTNPTKIKIKNLTMAASDKWVIHAPPAPSGWNATTNPTPAVSYVQIWVYGTGDAIKLDDGGTVVVESNIDGASGLPKAYVQVQIYVDHNIKIGETKETKTNSGGFDVQSDDAKDLLIFGVTAPDVGKMPKDDYLDPLGNDSVYTPYKASGNIVFTENDFTGAIYAPDHNIVFNNSADGRGKRHKRHNSGADFYGSYVGRTINLKKGINVHFDESLNDWGPIKDYGYVSWFEDVDVDNR